MDAYSFFGASFMLSRSLSLDLSAVNVYDSILYAIFADI